MKHIIYAILKKVGILIFFSIYAIISVISTAKAAPPTLTYPPDGEVIVPLQSGFSWTGPNTKFVFQIALDANFTQIVLNCDTITQNTYVCTMPLSWATLYYWRVRKYSESTWSSVWHFVTIIEEPNRLYPPDSSSAIPINSKFLWNTAGGALTYSIKVKEAGYPDYIIDASGINDTSYLFKNIKYDTKYIWYIFGDKLGSQSYWPKPWVFRTILQTPEPASPEQNTHAVPLQGTLAWHPVSGADTYRVQLAEESDFIGYIINAVVTDTTQLFNGLEHNKRYYWRVNATNSYSTSNWSTSYFFFTNIAVPKLLKHTTDSKKIPVKDTLRWNHVKGADSYNLQIASDVDFNNLDTSLTGIMDSSFIHTGLKSKSKYFWRVSATNSYETTNWSDLWNFTTQLNAPLLLYPENDSTGVPLEGMLVWQAVTGAIKYRIQISTTPDFSNIVVDKEFPSTLYYEYNELTPFTKYYWRVCVDDGEEVSPWSEEWSFVTNLEPPTLLTPSNNIKISGINGVLSWYSIHGADSYNLQLSEQLDFSSFLINRANITDTLYPFSGLQYNKIYYWRVNAKNSDGVSKWSDINNFKTIIASPLLVSPANDTSEVPLDGLLSWQSVVGAETYNLVLSENDDFSNPFLNKTGIAEAYYNYTGLTQLTRYYWQVKAVNSDCEGNWSDVWVFSTKLGESIDELSTLMDNTLKLSFYPNPISDKTEIALEVPSSAYVTLNIYNLFGQKVASIINNYLYEGSYTYEWNSAGLTEGIYFANITSGGNSKVIKLLNIEH